MVRGRISNQRPSIPPTNHLDAHEWEFEDFDDAAANATLRLDKDTRPARHRHLQLAHWEREVIEP